MSITISPISDLAELPTERLEAEATTLAGHLAAAMRRFLDLVAELARREAWQSWEARSMAHWVSWKCGIGPRAAQEHVRVALALTELPVTRAEFAIGQLSYSKVRALTRFITPGNETDTVALARHTTASQLERIARAHVAACRVADPDRARAALHASAVSMASNEDGTTTLTLRMPADVACRAMAAIRDAAQELPQEDRAEPGTALVLGFAAVMDSYLEPDPERPGIELVLHADVESLSEDAAGRCELADHPIATEAARRIACDCSVRFSLDRAAGPSDLGRRARNPNPSLRRAILVRDHGRCRFPGCTQTTRLRIHHARHWAHGGPTDAWNLIAVCPTHHRSVHEGGWHVEANGHGGFTFVDPRGQAVPEFVVPGPARTCHELVAEHIGSGLRITPESIASLSEGEPMDLDWTMMTVCCAHPPAPRPDASADACVSRGPR